ncbi:MAG: ABC transporter substrate-binding protein [Alphaproteobacteria bacterium]|nr:ABC transporter substrate-binding protein [Alphaproteobacteria bacterium SS10]
MIRFLMLGLVAIAITVPGMARAEKMNVLLDWFVNPVHAPLVIADAKGYFAEAELEIEIIPPADPSDPPKLVAAKRADVAISYQPQLHMQIDQGLPLVRIGTLVGTPLNIMVTLADSGIESIADLKGKRIGYSVGGVEEALVQAMLEHAGLTLSDVEMINVNFSLSPSLLAGQVDAVTGAFRNFELNQMDLEGHPGRAFFIEESGVPVYDELIFVAHQERRDDPQLATFIQAVERGIHYMINHPAESWEIFTAAYPALDDELNRRAWRDTLPRFDLRPAALDADRYRRFAQFMADKALIEAVVPVEQYAVVPGAPAATE